MNLPVNISQYTDYRVALQDFHKAKQLRFRGWSHAVWARKLGLKSPSMLSMILHGERHPSPELAKSLATSLGLPDRDQQYFSLLVELQKHKETPEISVLLMEKLSRFRPDRKFTYLDLDQFSYISHWYYAAIREMVKLKGFREDSLWIARRLSFKVSVQQVREAIRVLLRLNLLKRLPFGQLVQAQGNTDTQNDIPSEGIKRFHEETLQNAAHSVRLFSPQERDLYSSTFVTSRAKLPEAKALIRKFHDDLCDLMEKDEGDAVFQLEVALFPVARLKVEGS